MNPSAGRFLRLKHVPNSAKGDEAFDTQALVLNSLGYDRCDKQSLLDLDSESLWQSPGHILDWLNAINNEF